MPNSDPNSPKLEGLEAVLELARDKSGSGRKALMSAITDLFAGAGPAMSESERALSEDILRRLVEDVEVTAPFKICTISSPVLWRSHWLTPENPAAKMPPSR